MCGRYALHSLVNDLQKHFGLFDSIEFAPRFNAAPALKLPIVRCRDERRELALCQWGFVPHWMKSRPKTRPINARAETAAEKPFFRVAMRRRRCLIPANGFYEWTHALSPKQPWYFRLKDSEIMAFAGLWDSWSHEGEMTETFAILTTSANATLRPVHDRMPVILDPTYYDAWLDQGDAAVLGPYSGAMTGYPVGRAVNSAGNEGPELLRPVT
ncbi:MAG: SOS response-associated peptidase [Gammaproteobacteria bacterium]|nr:SOS response-associated peptidase [Gammaproteobacteria bacterium]